MKDKVFEAYENVLNETTAQGMKVLNMMMNLQTALNAHEQLIDKDTKNSDPDVKQYAGKMKKVFVSAMKDFDKLKKKLEEISKY